MLHHAVVFCLEFRSAVQCHLPDCVVGVPVHARQVTMTEGCNSNKTSTQPVWVSQYTISNIAPFQWNKKWANNFLGTLFGNTHN